MKIATVDNNPVTELLTIPLAEHKETRVFVCQWHQNVQRHSSTWRTHARSVHHDTSGSATATGSDSEVTLESTKGLVEKAASQTVGTCPQRPVSTPGRQELEQVMRWVGPVCNDRSGSGVRPLDDHLLPSKELALNVSSGLTTLLRRLFQLVLCGAATLD